MRDARVIFTVKWEMDYRTLVDHWQDYYQRTGLPTEDELNEWVNQWTVDNDWIAESYETEVMSYE